MSNQQSGFGTIILPSGEAAKLRKKLRDFQILEQEKSFVYAQKLLDTMTPEEKKEINPNRTLFRLNAHVSDMQWNAARMVEKHIANRGVNSKVLKKSDLPKIEAARKVFYGEDSIRIEFENDGKSVYVDYDGNRALDNMLSRQNSLWDICKDHFSKMKWTRGTGGIIEGEDEYAGDGNVMGFGPLGASQDPSITYPYLDSSGVRVDPEKFRNPVDYEKLYRNLPPGVSVPMGGSVGHVGGGRCGHPLPRGGYCGRPFGHRDGIHRKK